MNASWTVLDQTILALGLMSVGLGLALGPQTFRVVTLDKPRRGSTKDIKITWRYFLLFTLPAVVTLAVGLMRWQAPRWTQQQWIQLIPNLVLRSETSGPFQEAAWLEASDRFAEADPDDASWRGAWVDRALSAALAVETLPSFAASAFLVEQTQRVPTDTAARKRLSDTIAAGHPLAVGLRGSEAGWVIEPLFVRRVPGVQPKFTVYPEGQDTPPFPTVQDPRSGLVSLLPMSRPERIRIRVEVQFGAEGQAVGSIDRVVSISE